LKKWIEEFSVSLAFPTFVTSKLKLSHFNNPYQQLILSHQIATDIIVYGHHLHIPCLIIGRRVAFFSFQDLCHLHYGAADYIALAQMFSVIAISNVPILTLQNRNELRRFITLIDALYDHHILVLISAQTIPMQLLDLREYIIANSLSNNNNNNPQEIQMAIDEAKATVLQVYDEVFAFDRTVSRLLEIQSVEYVRKAMETHHISFAQASNYMFLRTLIDDFLREFHHHHHSSNSNNSHELTSQHGIISENQWQWMMKRLWIHYRIGTIDEIQHALTSSQSNNHNNNPEFDGMMVGTEVKQVILRESLLIMCKDIVDYFLHDLLDEDLITQHYELLLIKVQTIDSNSYISYIQASYLLKDLITELVRKRS
jgi:hypothetical protein